jgi:hypothetical protein
MFIKRGKKAQLTIFIVIAILVIAVVGLFFVFRDNSGGEKSSGDVDISDVVNFIDGCLEESGMESLHLIGLRGGYLDPHEASTNFGVPFYLYEGSPNIPTKQLIEQELSKSVESLIPLCFENMSLAEEFVGLEVELARDPRVKTFILEDRVDFELNYPIKVSKGESSSVVEDFDQSVNVRLDVLYGTSEFVVRDYLENSMNLCISCLLDLQLNFEE